MTIERKKFERWMKAKDAGRKISPNVFASNGDGGYLYESVQTAWEAWQARAAS